MTASGPPGPPSPPAMASPPPVPEGWKAEWSVDHKTWYYFNQGTQTSTWENPLNKAPPPPSPPPYASSSNDHNSNRSISGDSEKTATTRGVPPVLGHLFHSHSHSLPVNEQTRPTLPAGLQGGAAPLYIHAASYSDQDVTQKVRGMVTPQHTLSIRCDALAYHFGDPWPNHRKQFSILYSYGQQPWQLVATSECNDTIKLHPIHPIDVARTAFVQQPSNKVIALLWGTKNALVDQPYMATGRSAGLKMMEIETEGRLEASNAWMGFDGFPNNVKMAVAYYRNADGSVGIAAAREGETLRLPWNPFAGAI